MYPAETSGLRQHRYSRFAILIICGALLSGCYFPTNGIRDANPAPSSSPPWPYESGTYPPGGGAPSLLQPVPPSPAPRLSLHEPGQTPPPPGQNSPERYADWLFDGSDGRGFAWYLAQGYRRYAKHEDNAHDFEDAARFLARAAAVERGEVVEPEQLTQRVLPVYAVEDLAYARQRLMRALRNGAAGRLPKVAANAQVAFDCWMEQQEENSQPHDVARCRSEFETHIVRLEGPQHVAPPACPPVETKCVPATHLLFFELDRHELMPAARETVRLVVEQAKVMPMATLIVAAHADRSGTDRHNDALSRQRLDSVVVELVASGVPRERVVRAEYHGERQPRIPTHDGIRQPENRRVEIRVSCTVPSEAPSACAAPSLPERQPGCMPKFACPQHDSPAR